MKNNQQPTTNSKSAADGRDFALLVVSCWWFPASASADILVFKNGRSMSVKTCKLDAETATVLLRAGGEVTFPASMIARVDPDEVPYPDPAEAAPSRDEASVVTAAPVMPTLVA